MVRSIKVNHHPNFNYHLCDPKVIKYVFEDHFEDYVKGPVIQKSYQELFGTFFFRKFLKLSRFVMFNFI